MTKIIFMGTPNFAVPVLEGLIKADYDVIGVVTQPDKKVGRKQKLEQSPVKVAALSHDIKVYQPLKLSKSEELTELIALEPDLIVTAAYGQFLPEKFLQAAKIAAVNVHGSLLPKYRGGAPIQYSLMNGDAKTGVTIMEMVKKMDAGDIFAQVELPLTEDDNNGTVFDKLSIMGRDLLLETLPQIIDQTVTRIPQDEELVTFSPTIQKEEEQIKLELSATEANNLVRALSPKPGAYLIFNGERLKVFKAQVAEESTSLPAGSLVNNHKELSISMANGTILRLLEVQPVGKKVMDVHAFLNGRAKELELGEKVVTND